MTIHVVDAGTGVGHFKGGVYGRAGAGKSWTSTLFLCGIKKYTNHKGRLWYFDTESGVEYLNPLVKRETGENLLVVKSRALGDAIEFMAEAEKAGAAGVIIDSVSHIWDEVQATFIKTINEHLKRNNKSLRTKIEWQDRGQLNAIWEKFTTAYLNTPLHTIICGRAANIWEMEVNEETGKKELNKVGTKMKTQSEMAYEPSFLAEMEAESFIDANGVKKIRRHITVLKERFGVLDGATAINPGFDFILPHIKLLTPGASNSIDVTKETKIEVNDDGDTGWAQEKMQKQIYSEEIINLFKVMIPGKSALEEKAKVIALQLTFGMSSWSAIEKLSSVKLKNGINILRDINIPAALDQVKAEDKEPKETKTKKVSA